MNRLKEQVRQTAMIQREKDRLESEYQRSQKRFRTVFEESVIGKKIIDDQLRIVKVNRAVLAMLGYSENELTGKLITDFAQADFIPRWKELQEELWTNERPSFSFDTCLIKKDGTSFWCHITTIIIEDNGDRLGYTILEDISERKELERLRELVREQEHRQEIAEAILNTQEEERKRIAESLHNGLGQMLYGAKLSLSSLSSARDGNEREQAIRYSEKLLDNCIHECRRISHDLTPAILEEYGLIEAVRDICQQMSGPVKFDCLIKGSHARTDRFMEVISYRIIQELMVNVIKHAGATHAVTKIEMARNGIHISVHDNGKGFDPSTVKAKGIGLQSIRSKVILLSGDLDISSAENAGTTVTIYIPKRVK